MSTAFPHTCDLEAERERLRLVPPQLGKVRSRRRQTRSGLKIYWYLDFDPHLKGRERFLHGIIGSSFANRAEAERTLARIVLDSARLGLEDAAAQFRRPRARQNLVMTHAERWLAEVRPSMAPHTLRSYRGVLRLYFDFWSYRSIREITTGALREWIAELRGRGLSGRTVQLAMTVLKLTLQRYREDHPNVVAPVWPKIQRKRAPRAPMPLADILEALAQIREPDLGIYLCCLYTLCRPGEARAAVVGDYDFREGRLTICRALKTDSGRDPLSGATKTGESGVYIVPEELRAWISKYRGEARLRPQEPLFPNPRTGNAWEAKRLREFWRAACARAKVVYVSMYRALKHSPGTALLEAGLSREDLQAAYRHRSERMTMVYELEDSRRRQRATQRLEELVGERLNRPANNSPTAQAIVGNGSSGSEAQESPDE